MKVDENTIREIVKNSITEYFEEAKKGMEYQDLFMDTLDKFSDMTGREINDPGDLDDAEKAAFFNYLDTKWDTEEGKIRDVEVNIDLNEMIRDHKIRHIVREHIYDMISN